MRLVPGLVVVVVSMLALFTLPRDYFVLATFVSTGLMVVAAVSVGGLPRISTPKPRTIATGLVSAALLYLVFVAGAFAVDTLHPFGINSTSYGSIYSLIASPSNAIYVQVGVLLFDSLGYESFFRGVLQKSLQRKIGVAAAPAVALFDAGLHIATLNPLWVGTTFVADLVWGLTYHYGKGVQPSFISHFVWDIAIFLVRPLT